MTHPFATIAILVGAACAQHTAIADSTSPSPGKPRCPPNTRCGPPTSVVPPGPPPAELVHPSVTTVATLAIDGVITRAISGRGPAGAFVTLEKLDGDKVASRTAVRFEGVGDVADLDVIQLMWRTDRHGDLVFHLGAAIGGHICHLEKGSSLAKCVVARGGGRPSK